ncbi:MAG: DUF1565 domain-containing protein [Verrucomicrobia bacterium]|nr:DUF1565 domain-containing protein [Verrucomicrobiota bacterium]
MIGMLLPLAGLRAAEWHVAVTGKDSQRGTKDDPLRTIQRAADLAQPGDTVTVHAGVYRERVNPPRGGESDAKRIIYRASPGEKVEIKGSEVVTNWKKVQNNTWKATLPNTFFGKFNPYSDLIHGDWYNKSLTNHTGAVYLNDKWLRETKRLEDVLKPADDNMLWNDTTRLPVWMSGNVFLKGAKPSKHETGLLLKPDFDPALNLLEKTDGLYLEITADNAWATERTRQLVTTELLGKAVIPDQAFENPDGTPLRIDTDYFGKKRNEKNPFPGPFENPAGGKLTLKVWETKKISQ